MRPSMRRDWEGFRELGRGLWQGKVRRGSRKKWRRGRWVRRRRRKLLLDLCPGEGEGRRGGQGEECEECWPLNGTGDL